MMKQTHHTAISSQAPEMGKVQRLSLTGVGPSGSKCGAPLAGGDIVWPLSKDKEGRETSDLVRNISDWWIRQLQRHVYGNTSSRHDNASEVDGCCKRNQLKKQVSRLLADAFRRRSVGTYTVNQRKELVNRQLAFHPIALKAAGNNIPVDVSLCGVDAIHTRITNFQFGDRGAFIDALNLVLHAMNIRRLFAAIRAIELRNFLQFGKGEMTIPSTPPNLRMKIPPHRFYASLTRLAATGWTTAIAQFSIGANTNRSTTTLHTTSALSLTGKTFVKIILKNSPPIDFLSNAVERIFLVVNIAKIRTAIHAYLSRQVFHLALHGYLECVSPILLHETVNT